jgi:AraC family transcriptional regulator, transcriptional activator FtrA
MVRDISANALERVPGLTRSSLPGSSHATAQVAIIVYDGVGVFELGVACDIFGTTDITDLGLPWYRLSVCGADRAMVTAEGGLQIQPPCGLERARHADLIVVPPTNQLATVPVQVFELLRRAHARGCRILSLCTGAFVLAEAGLLSGRRATTHWSECGALSREYADVSVDPGVLYVDEGDILTSAGSAASIDLCLHVVRGDYGSEVATQLARQLVVAPQRDGGQAQFIEAPLPSMEHTDYFADTVTWAEAHLAEPLTVADLAARSAMSPRTFARQFLAATGTSPHQWLQLQRVHLAQRLLEVTDLPIESVAQQSGFRTAGNLRKYFNRVMHTSPQSYRRTFQDRSNL